MVNNASETSKSSDAELNCNENSDLERGDKKSGRSNDNDKKHPESSSSNNTNKKPNSHHVDDAAQNIHTFDVSKSSDSSDVPDCFKSTTSTVSTRTSESQREQPMHFSKQSSIHSLRALLDKDDKFANPRTLIRQASTFLSETCDQQQHHDHLSVDDERLQRALEDAGKYSYGIAAVEVWQLNEETGRLCRPGSSAAWWTNNDIMTERSPPLLSLDDPTHDSYTEPRELMPGIDLAGKLFTESKCLPKHAIRNYISSQSGSGSNNVDDSLHSWSSRNSFTKGNDFIKRMTNSFDSRPKVSFGGRMTNSFDSRPKVSFVGRMTNSFDSRPKISFAGPEHKRRMSHQDIDKDHEIQQQAEAPNKDQNVLKFRDIKSLLMDPDTLKTPRLQLLLEAGFVQAAGVPFHTGWHKGIVIFYTKIMTEEEQHYAALTSMANELYLLHAAEIIGSVVASAESRRASFALKLYSSKQNINSRGTLGRVGGDVDPEDSSDLSTTDDNDPQIGNDKNKRQYRLRHQFELWWKKCSNVSSDDSLIPPCMSWNQSILTFFGAFLGLLLMMAIDTAIRFFSSNQYFLLAGPIGALMTLQYGLTSAPASQPRNVLLSPILVGCVTIPFTYIPHDVLPIWVRQSLAAALSISAMAKFGILHPPAGGLSIILASGGSSRIGWEFIIISVIASAISIVPAVLINNLSQKRQYPAYWGYSVKVLNGIRSKSTRKKNQRRNIS